MATQDRARNVLAQIDQELKQYPLLNKIEQTTHVPKAYGALAVVVLYFTLVAFNCGAHFLVNVSGFIIPAYWSIGALFTAQKQDDKQWLTYWVVFGLFTVVESTINAANWIPFYYLIKLALVFWMILPQTRGAQVVFYSVIQPLFANHFSATSSLRAQAENAAADAGKPHSS